MNKKKELCIRCGKPTIYHPNTPITLRRYYVEGSGQLCEQCFYELYPVPGSLQSNMDVDSITTGKDSNTDYSKIPIDPRSVQL
jgi:hypothetical protein